MLNHPHRSTRRQQLSGLVATLLAVTTAYAAQSAPADEDLRLDLRLDLAIADTAGGPARHQSSPRLITADGQPVIVGLNPAAPGEGAWEIVMFPKRLADGRIEIVTTFRDGQPLATHPGSHTQQAGLGEPSELRVRALDGKTELVMSRRVELIDRHALPGATPR